MSDPVREASGKQSHALSPRVLLTLGRLPKGLDVARALSDAGCAVYIAEPFRWHVCKPSNAVVRSFRVTAPNDDLEAYLAELESIVRAQNISLIVPVSEEALHVAQLRPRLPDGVRIFSPPTESLRALHDKLRFSCLREMGLEIPETHRATSAGATVLANRSKYVLKPSHSCSGTGLAIREVGQPIGNVSTDTLIQRFIDGQHISSLSVVNEGREIASVLYRGTVFSGTVAVCTERVESAACSDWISRFIRTHSKFTGFVAFDFIVDKDGKAWAIECNPRITSGVHFFEPEALAASMLRPETTDAIALKEKRTFQQGYTTLTEAYRAFFKPREFIRRFRLMLGARDVVWSMRDPWPFWLMTPMSWDILKPAIFSKMTLGEAAMRDIAWFGDTDQDRKRAVQ